MNKPTPITNVTVPLDTQVPVVFSAAFWQSLVTTLETMKTTLTPRDAITAAESIKSQVMAFAVAQQPKPETIDADA